MRILGYHVSSNGIVADSDGNYTTEPPYLDFLLEPKQDTMRILYYMTENISNLAKLTNLSEEEVKKFEAKNNKIYIAPYKLTYIPNKYFAVQKGYYWGAPFAFFSDAHQFKNVPATENENIEQCIEKAKEAQQIGEAVYNAMTSIGLKPKSLTSPIKTFETDVMEKLNLPNVDDIPEEAGYFAYECCQGNWVEAFQIGHWGKVYNYDICAAYPAKAAQLLDIRLGKWVESDKFVPEAKYGYCMGEINIKPDVAFTPFLYKQESNGNMPNLLAVTGKYPQFINKRGIELLGKWNQGTFKIDKGWWWIPAEEKKPLETIINWLYMQREMSDGEKRTVIKRIMAAIFGKMLEARGDWFGNQFNPVWAAEIEVGTRFDVAEFIITNAIKPIHIAVDNVITTGIVPTAEQGLGKWELRLTSPCICAGTGMIALRDNGVGEFHLKYDWLKEQIEANPKATEYTMVKKVPITIGEAIAGKYDKLGELQELNKTISIGKGEKRCYKEQPSNGEELLSGIYESVPWDISLAVRSQTEIAESE